MTAAERIKDCCGASLRAAKQRLESIRAVKVTRWSCWVRLGGSTLHITYSTPDAVGLGFRSTILDSVRLLFHFFAYVLGVIVPVRWLAGLSPGLTNIQAAETDCH